MTSTNVITIVSGLPRSGTSMIMKMLNVGGLEVVTDHVRKADVDNPMGYYETERVKKIREDASWVAATQGKAFKMIVPLLPHLPLGFQYQVILMRRDMGEILRSQNKMLERLGRSSHEVPDEKLADLFARQLSEITRWLEEQDNLRVLDVNYNDVLEDPAQQVRRLAEFVEQDLGVRPMLDIIDPALYRNKAPSV